MSALVVGMPQSVPWVAYSWESATWRVRGRSR